MLKQNEHQPLRASEQMIILKAVNAGLLDDVNLDQVGQAETLILHRVGGRQPAFCERLDAGEALLATQWQQVLDMAAEVLDLNKNSLSKRH